MSLTCQVVRNSEGGVKEVLAFNKKPSKLYQTIREMHPEFSEGEALRQYAKFYTPSFRSSFGDFVQGESTIGVDVNGEPIYTEALMAMGGEMRAEKFFQIKNLFNTATELNEKLKSKNQKTKNLSDKKIKAILKQAGLEPSLQDQFVRLVNAHPELKELRISEVIDTYLNSFIKESDKQYYAAIGQPLSQELEKILREYFAPFGITEVELDSLKEKFGVDSVGVFDVLAKTIYYEKDRNLLTLSEEYGHVFIELLGAVDRKNAGNPLFRHLSKKIETWDGYDRVYNSYKDIYLTPDGNTDLFRIKKEAMGQAIGIALVRNYKTQTGDPGFWKTIQDVIDHILNLISGLNYVSLQTSVDSIAKDILNKNYDELNRLGKDTSNYNLLGYSETIELQNQKDGGRALRFMQWFSDLGAVITGSLAYRLQTKVYRPAIDALHDIDIRIPSDIHNVKLKKEDLYTKEELERDKLYKKYASEKNWKEARKYKVKSEKIDLEKITDTKFFRDIKKQYPNMEFLYTFSHRRHDSFHITVNAIWSENQTLKDKFKSLTGSFNDRLENFTEDEIDQFYLFDFFLMPESSEEMVTVPDEEFKLNLVHASVPLASKLLDLGRPKDAFDYQMWEYYNQDSILAPDLNSRLVYFQLKPQEDAAQGIPSIKDISAKDSYQAIFDEEYRHDLSVDNNNAAFNVEHYNSKVAGNLIKQLSAITGIKYEYITAQEARLITEDSLNPWTGQSPAFFFNDKVYFVSKYITPEIALHEYSHVFVRHIKNVNRPLFDKLFTDLVKTDEGQQALAESLKEYKNLRKEEKGIPDIIKEETIVKALTTRGLAIQKEEGVSKKFNNIIEKIIYHIKQALRKIFGKKVKVEKLDVDTTLHDLAQILKGSDKINIKKEFLSQDDIVAYIQNLKDLNKDLNNLYESKKEELGVFVDQQFEAIKSLYNTLNEETKEFGDIKRILVSDTNTGFINQMMKLKYYTSISELDPKRKEVMQDVDAIEYAHEKVRAVSDNFLLMNAMLNKINDYLELAKEDPDQQDVLREIRHYDNLVKIWDGWLTSTKSGLLREGLSEKSPLYQHLNELQGLSDSINEKIKAIMTEAVSEAVVLANPVNEVLQFRYNQEKERLEKLIRNSSGQAKKAYERMLQEEKYRFERSYLDEDTVKAYLSGAVRRDNNRLNAMFLNYIGNPDPIVGTFGKYLKEHYTKAQTNALLKANKFFREMNEVMKKAGYKYNATLLNRLADDVLFDDEIGYIESDGSFKVYKAPTFLTEFKNWDAVLMKYDYDIKKALDRFNKTQNPEHKEIYEQLIESKDQHLKLFFQRPYADEIDELEDQLLADVREVNGQPFEAGKEGKRRLDKILKEMEVFDISERVEDPLLHLEKLEERASLWRQYSSLFQERDAYGNMKEDEELAIAQALTAHRERKNKYYEWVPLEGEFENGLRGAEIRIKEKLTMDEKDGGDGLEVDSEEYKEAFNLLRQKWLDANLRTKLSDEFYERRGIILEEVSKIFKQIEESRIEASKKLGIEYQPMTRFDDIIKDINSVISSSRDNDGQPVGTEMTDEAISYVRSQQEFMVQAKKEFAKLNGLTQEEFNRVNHYWSVIKSKKRRLTPEEQSDFNKLREKQDALGVDPLLKDLLISYWEELESLQTKMPTEYYIEILDNWYQKSIRDGMANDPTILQVPTDANLDVAELVLDPEFINPYLKEDEDFRKWFKANHVSTTKFIEGVGTVPYYERVKVWSVVKPNDPKYYETTTLSDGEVIQGVPTLRYFRRAVKPSYVNEAGETVQLINAYNPKTKKVEYIPGVHKDATMTKWLPLPLEKMEEKRAKNPNLFSAENPYDKYINRDYLEMKKKNTPEYQVLEELKRQVSDFESSLPRDKRMGIHQLPRYRRDRYELLLEGGLKDKIVNSMQSVLDEWRKRKDDSDEGLNFEDDWRFSSSLSGMFAVDDKPIPVSGKFAIDEGQISRDIMGSIVLRMSSVELHKTLTESHPIAKGFQKLINELNPADVAPAITNLQVKFEKLGDYDDDRGLSKKELSDLKRRSYLQQGNPASMTPMKKNRKAAINAIYETWYEGKLIEDFKSDSFNVSNAHVKFVNNILKAASVRFFAFDIQSALKNFFGAQFQIGIEAAVGQTFYNPFTEKEEHLISYKSYTQGRLDAKLTGIELAKAIYDEGTQPLSTQLIYLFDAVEGMTEIGQDQRIGMSYSRSVARDAASLTWATTHRKYLENNVTLSFFYGAMNHIKVTQTVKGVAKEISYKDAWELDPDTGDIRLKEGIDKAYDINGSMFNLYKERIQEMNRFNQGMYSKMANPAASRHLEYKAFISMRKFFLKMFMQRWSYSNQAGGNIFKPSTWKYLEEKWNPALQEFHMGYFVRTLRTIARILESNGDYFLNMTKDEKLAAVRTMLAPIKAYLFMLVGFTLFRLWDWDPEDPDRFKKLKAKSGPLPIPFLVDEDYMEEYPFHLRGWVENQALSVILQTNAENRYFQLTPQALLSQINIIDNTSIANAAVIHDLIEVGDLMLQTITGDPDAVYSKRQGAMYYLQPGEAKFMKILNQFMGLKGKTIDPVTGLRNSEGYLPESKVKEGPISGIIGY